MANPTGSNQTLTKIYNSVLNAIRVYLVGLAESAAFSTASNTRPSVTNVASTILAANSNRKYVLISNNTGATIYLKLGATAVVDQGIRIGPNDFYEIRLINLWTGSISAIKATAVAVNLDVFEGT